MMNEIEDEVIVKPAKTESCLFSALKNALFNPVDLNDDKIEFLKQQIESGQYQISSKAIAIKMLPVTE